MVDCLILGGGGFIGGNLARALVAKQYNVRIFTRSTSSLVNITDILDQVEIVYGDFMDDIAVRKAVKGVDIVFHLISTTFPNTTRESSVYDVFSNLIPTIRLVEICLANNISKIVYASSGGTVYGEPKQIPIPETHPLEPTSLYGQSKLTIENYLQFYNRTTELDVNILRISNPFGPGQKLLGVQGIISVAMGCVIYDREIKIYGQGETVRDYIYIGDVINALILVAEKSGSSLVNISSGIGRSVLEVIEAVEEVTDKKIKRQFIAPRLGDVKTSILSNQLAKDIYHWQPKIEFKDGLSMAWKQIKKTIN